jgi:hypothetical protein
VALGRYIGPCLSEYTQPTQDKVNVHSYPSGTTVVKASVANDFIFYDKRQCTIIKLCEASLHKAALVKITWQMQKNRQNNQAITLAANMAKPDICPVRSAMRMVLKACQLHQPDNMLIAIYKTKKGKTFYLTGNKIAELLRKAVWMVCPDTSPDNLKRCSAHLLHVWAYVLLDKARKSPKYIKKRLCWLGDSFRMYLRDTTQIQHQHLDALQAALQEVMDIIVALPKNVIPGQMDLTIWTCTSTQTKWTKISTSSQ